MIKIWISLSGPEVERPHDSGAFGRPTGDRSKQSIEAERKKKTRDFIEETGKHPDDPEAPERDEEKDEDKTEMFNAKSFGDSDLAEMSGSEIQNLHDKIPTETR